MFELHRDPDATGVITIEDFEAGTDTVRVAGGNTGGFSIQREEDSGDALVLENGKLVARLLGPATVLPWKTRAFRAMHPRIQADPA
ncbi:hypothetical protein ETW23_09975 [Leisingera sp. NJS201]|nr:hypothetical protein ETW23_09975 [Leisingera sp. NJS201]